MLNDHKGSVQVVVNESGAKVEETFYSPFGEIISGGSTTRFDYEGKEFDSVVGDYDYHARKYCPGLGRFCTPDSMLPNVYDPQQLNRYAFEKNNPQNFKDEEGNAAIWIHGMDTFVSYAVAGFSLSQSWTIAKGAMEPDLYRSRNSGWAQTAAKYLHPDLKMEHSDDAEKYYHEESDYNLEADYWNAINSGDLEKAGNIEHALGHDVGSGGIPGYHSNAAFQNQFNFKLGSKDIKPVHWLNDVSSSFLTNRNALNIEQANRAKSAYQQLSGGGGSSGSWSAYQKSTNVDTGTTTYTAAKGSGNGYTWTSVTVSNPKKK